LFTHVRDGESRFEGVTTHPFNSTQLFGTLFADLLPEAILAARCSANESGSHHGAVEASLVHPWVHPLNDVETGGPRSDGRL
jgi:hypothetical protein